MSNWLSGLFSRIKNRMIPEQTVERDFGAVPAVSREMADNIGLWYTT